ncbi:hypothetical protein RSAG8_08413, partial [Rhizoctonia solani AG-8 WAC10335]
MTRTSEMHPVPVVGDGGYELSVAGEGRVCLWLRGVQKETALARICPALSVSVMVLDVINQTETMSGIPVTNELQPEAHITSPRRRIRVHIDPPRKSVIVSKHAYLADAMQQSMPSGATRPGLHLSPTQAFSSQIEIDEEWSWDFIGITKRSDHML